MVVASQSYSVQFFAFALATLRQTFGASWCTMLVPGTNIRIMRAAMRAGLTIEAVRLFASDGGMLDLSRYVGFHRCFSRGRDKQSVEHMFDEAMP